jgi:uncharacterized protein (TIGR03083 family)
MDHLERIDATERELGALHEAMAAGDLAAPVPTCPDWTVADLAVHVGQFLGFWTHVLCEGTGTPKTPFPDPPAGDARRGWLVDLGGHALDQLRRTDPATPVWTWYEPDQSAGFVARRVVNELAIHRYDTQAARGTAAPVEATLAVDGIDEVLGPLLRREPTGRASGQTIHLHGTDDGLSPPAEWLVTLLPDRIDVARTHAKGDLALRAGVSDLELLLYRRPPLGDVQRFGDESVLDLWYDEFTF